MTNTTTIYQPISLDDINSLMTIEQQCHSHPWSEKLMRSCIGGRYFGETLRLANAPDIIHGFYIADYIAQESNLMDICIAPQWQGKGLGKQLLNRFMSQAKSRGAEKLFLEVRASNTPAQMLYINAGFIQIDRRLAYYPKVVGYEDAIVMSINL
jgi:ribosomal-protein-alanine N-acetyltransferase